MPASSSNPEPGVPRGLKVLLGRLAPRHLPAVQQIERASFTQPWSQRIFAAELTNPHALPLCLVTLPAEMLVAYLILWLVGEEVQIQNLAVHPSFRRRGLGRYLLHRGLGEAAARGARLATLEVRPSNLAARRLYLSLGFVQTGRRPGYYQAENEDAILLDCDLAAAGFVPSPAPAPEKP